MAWRSRLYWSNIACDGASVAAVGDGEGVEWSSTGMAWRSGLYWSNIACESALVAAGGDGEGVEWSWTGLVGEASLVGGVEWQFLTSGHALVVEAVDDGLHVRLPWVGAVGW